MTLKEYLKKSSLTFRAFSLLVNIDAAQLCRYANGQQLPSLESAYKIYIKSKRKVNLKDWMDEKR
jgi:transcriptional regulator with XRE-family HTH domain